MVQSARWGIGIAQSAMFDAATAPDSRHDAFQETLMASPRAGGLALSSRRRMGSGMFMASDTVEDASAPTRVSRATNAGQLLMLASFPSLPTESTRRAESAVGYSTPHFGGNLVGVE